MTATAFIAARIFNGVGFISDTAIVVDHGSVSAIVERRAITAGIAVRDLGDVILSPGFVDVQVNGGGGVLLNNDVSPSGIKSICAAHRALGTTSLLATLITDTPDNTAKAVSVAIEAQRINIPGFAGLHLEGPHLSVKRQGAHDPALIRPMEQCDLDLLLSTKAQLGTLLVTVAPESVSMEQIRTMSQAGIIVSLGHSDCSYDTAMQCFDAGACMVTHLFNAMSQMGNREPGLAGAALASGAVSAGLIADGIHVHPAMIGTAVRAKQGPGSVFLVTDAMATVGSDIKSFMLNGREILRANGRLTLADGTLAGADVDMPGSLRTLRDQVNLPLEKLLRMATSGPADVIGRPDLGRIAVGSRANLMILQNDLSHAKLLEIQP